MPISVAPRQPTMILQRIPSCASEEVPVNNLTKETTKKSVTFYETVEVRDSLHLADMTSKEINKAWYCRGDYTAFKRCMAEDVRAMTCGKPLGPEFSRRGLEYRTREGSNRRKANKTNSINAVLDEQDLQMAVSCICPKTLRLVYLEHSAHCATNASLLGKTDELEVKLIKENDQKEAEQRDLHDRVTRSSKTGKKILRRLFAKKRAVVEEIKRIKKSH